MAVNAALFKTKYKRESAFLLTPVNSGGAKIAEQRRVHCASCWYCRRDLESKAWVLKLSVTDLTEAYGEKAEKMTLNHREYLGKTSLKKRKK